MNPISSSLPPSLLLSFRSSETAAPCQCREKKKRGEERRRREGRKKGEEHRLVVGIPLKEVLLRKVEVKRRLCAKLET